MAVYKRGSTWWYEFILAGRRIRESAQTTRKQIAIEAERNRRIDLEKALAGIPVEKRENRIRRVKDITDDYARAYPTNHRPSSVAFMKVCIGHVNRMLGAETVTDLTEQRIKEYMAARVAEGAGGRSVNAELGELSRAIGKSWKTLWPRVRKMEERSDVGVALTADEEQRLLAAAAKNRSPNLLTLVRMALATGMRAGELVGLQWGRVDFGQRLMTVARSKTEAGRRIIPMSTDIQRILTGHREWFMEKFGEPEPGWYVFPFGSPYPTDPTRPTSDLSTAWTTTRTAAGLSCRWHDLRHTACTKMAEAGVPEGTMLAIMGHMSRAMLERYSHVRMEAKREAVEAMSPQRDGPPTDPPTASTKPRLRLVVNH
ncbi:MAG: tyrosine-type recombinase/integrase [Bryobacterales bacterium]|nr:tyrosine-type recombinase/integrase [Bryobacterales bacterium]